MISLPTTHLKKTVEKRTNFIVHSGPFRGIRYVNKAVGSGFFQKIIGCYEKELHSVLEEVKSISFKRLINIGAAEGYYAVGCLKLIQDLHAIAFETEEKGRTLMYALASHNGVANRLTIKGNCDVPDLMQIYADKEEPTLLICDVEGAEDTLLNIDQVPGLKTSFLLVELHEQHCPGITKQMKSRFADTHSITEILSQERDGSEYPFWDPYIALIPKSYKRSIVKEGRKIQMSWLWMKPHVANVNNV